jgi:hypothetical protein
VRSPEALCAEVMTSFADLSTTTLTAAVSNAIVRTINGHTIGTKHSKANYSLFSRYNKFYCYEPHFRISLLSLNRRSRGRPSLGGLLPRALTLQMLTASGGLRFCGGDWGVMQRNERPASICRGVRNFALEIETVDSPKRSQM